MEFGSSRRRNSENRSQRRIEVIFEPITQIIRQRLSGGPKKHERSQNCPSHECSVQGLLGREKRGVDLVGRLKVGGETLRRWRLAAAPQPGRQGSLGYGCRLGRFSRRLGFLSLAKVPASVEKRRAQRRWWSAGQADVIEVPPAVRSPA